MTDTYWPGDVSVGPLADFLNPPGEPPDTDDGYTAEDEAAYWAAVDAAAAGGSS